MIKSSFLETIKSLDGKIYNIDYHQKRYESVLSSLGIFTYKKLSDYLHPPQNGLYRCRLTYSTDAIDVTYHPYKKKEVRSLKIVYDDTIEYAKKSTQRDALDALYELKEDCDDVLIVKNGLITDTSIANTAFFKDGVWYTPSAPLLCGTTRQRLLDSGFLTLKDIRVEELQSYSKIALLNAMIDFDIITSKCLSVTNDIIQ